jgi:hypothetical protein
MSEKINIMIQRIQSVYLLLTTILSGLFLTGNIFSFFNKENSEFIMNFRGLYEVPSDKSYELTETIIPVTLISVLVPLISLITIFLFKNRKLQLKTTLILIMLEVLLIAVVAYYGISSIQRLDAIVAPVFRMFIPVITVILTILAYRGIKKDENLVRSYDRLR